MLFRSGRDAVQDYFTINPELEKYSQKLSALSQIVVLTKTDLIAPEILDQKIADFKKKITPKNGVAPIILAISSITNSGLENLKNIVWQNLEKIPRPPAIEIEETNFDKRDKTSLEITRADDGTFVVSGGYVDNLVRGIVLSDFNSFSYFQMRLKRDGIIDKLKEKGMKEGDQVKIKDIEFIYEE